MKTLISTNVWKPISSVPITVNQSVVITKEDLDRVVFDADNMMEVEVDNMIEDAVKSASLTLLKYRPHDAKGNISSNFFTPTEGEIRTSVERCIRAKSTDIRKLKIVISSEIDIRCMLYNDIKQSDLEISVELNFVGEPYFSFYYHGVELFYDKQKT